MALSLKQENEFTSILGDRFIAAKHELVTSSFDVGTLPKQVGWIMNNMPDAVVQPINASEIQQIYLIARKHNIPVVPRGAGTSGYGGAIPTKGGIVVDMRRMDSIIEIDAENLFVRTQPGISWSHLRFELNSKKLDLLCYPSSAIAATVGGWVSQGGDGIGSLKYGPINESVLEFEVVLPNSKIIRSKDRELFCDTQGILGIITEVKLRVRPQTKTRPFVASFPSNKKMKLAIEEILAEGPLPFTIKFEESKYASIKKNVWQEDEPYPFPKGHGIVLVAYEGGKNEISRGFDAVKAAATKHDGKVYNQQIAEHEWKERFYPMRIKKLGPSLVVGQAHVPLRNLDYVLEDFQSLQGSARAGVDGFITSKEGVTLMAYFLEDERERFFMLSWVQSFSILEIAERYGGHTHSTGLWLGNRAEEYFGKRQLAKIAGAKEKVDPNKISNPDKVYGFWFPWVLDFSKRFMLLGFELLINGPRSTLDALKWILRDLPPLKWLRDSKKSPHTKCV